MTSYGHDDNNQQTTVDDPPQHTQQIAFPSQRAYEEHDDAAAEEAEPVFSRALQYDRFGGTNWGAGFFGAVVTLSLGTALLAGVAAVSALLGARPDTALERAAQSPLTSLVGTAAVLLGLFVVACYAGGYVAGRMSRFDGGRQGFASWLLAVAVTALATGLALVATARAGAADLPASGLPEGLSPWWAVGSAAALLLGSLLAAVAGGRLGRRYHRRVDEAGYA